MRLLVTGGAGFIGSNLILSWIDKSDVEILVNLDCLTYAANLDNLKEITDHPKYVFRQIDVRDKAAILQIINEYYITHVVHLAAESHVDNSISNPDTFIQTNIVGTFNLLEACRIHWDQNCFNNYRFCYVSTDEVFGSLDSFESSTEFSNYAPNSPYSASKASADMLVRAYNKTYGLPTLVTHCSNNYGPYQHREKFIPTIILNIINQKQIPIYGNGLNIRDWIYVEDHIDALWKVLTQGKVGESYNIGTNNEKTNLEIVKTICNLIDRMEPKKFNNSQKLISFVKDRLGHDYRYAINSNKIKKELNWQPKYSFEEGLAKAIEWYLIKYVK